MIDPQIDDLEFESDSDEVGSDLDMDQIPEDREQEDSDEVQSIFYGAWIHVTFRNWEWHLPQVLFNRDRLSI